MKTSQKPQETCTRKKKFVNEEKFCEILFDVFCEFFTAGEFIKSFRMSGY
jgi:hypothetical protein